MGADISVHRHKSDIVACFGIFRTGISQTDQQNHFYFFSAAAAAAAAAASSAFSSAVSAI